MTKRILFFLAIATSLFMASCDDDDDGIIDIDPVTFDVTIENVSTPNTIATDRAMGTNPLSPPVYALFEGDNPMFATGAKANEGTERIAEDGFPEAMVSRLAANAAVKASAAVTSPGGPDDGPAVFAGESISFTITAEPGDKLQFETMFVQSNDWFYAFSNGGIDLFNGVIPVSGNFTDQVAVYDAGTEEDTAPGTGEFQKPVQEPMAADVGPAEDVDIQLASQRHAFTIPANSDVIRVTVIPRDN